MAQTVKNPPAMLETEVQSLGQEDSLEKKTATHSSILSWRIPWTKESGGLPSMGLQRVRHDWGLTQRFPIELKGKASHLKGGSDLGKGPLPICRLNIALHRQILPLSIYKSASRLNYSKQYLVPGLFHKKR